MKRIFIALMCVVSLTATGFTAQAQKKAPKPVVIELNFRNADDTGMSWPFVEKKLSKTADVKECALTEKETGYIFNIKANNPIYVNSTNGLMCGGLAGNYIQLPAVPRRSITEIQIMYPRKGSHGTLTITDEKGNMLEGGEGAKSKGDNYVHTWEIFGHKKGKAAKMMQTTDGSVMIKKLIIRYE